MDGIARGILASVNGINGETRERDNGGTLRRDLVGDGDYMFSKNASGASHATDMTDPNEAAVDWQSLTDCWG